MYNTKYILYIILKTTYLLNQLTSHKNKFNFTKIYLKSTLFKLYIVPTSYIILGIICINKENINTFNTFY